MVWSYLRRRPESKSGETLPGSGESRSAPVPGRRDRGREALEGRSRTLFFGVLGSLAALGDAFFFLYVLFVIETTAVQEVAGMSLPPELMGREGLFLALAGVVLAFLGLSGALLIWATPPLAAALMFLAALGVVLLPGPNTGLAGMAILFLVLGGFHALPFRKRERWDWDY